MEIKIGKPVNDIADREYPEFGKYAEIYVRLAALRGKDWLPLECEDRLQAVNLAQALRHRGAESRCRGLIVYARKKDRK